MQTHQYLVSIILLLAFCTIGVIVADDDPQFPVTSKVNYAREYIFSGAVKREQPKSENAKSNEGNQSAEPIKSFLDWYEDGVSSYLAKDWSKCVDNLVHAINEYRDYYSATASCRIQCASVARQVAPFFEDDVDDLHYYESAVRRTLCLVKCKRLLLPSIPEFFHMNQWSKEVFQTGKPYTYLQMCYFKTGKMLEATSATYTALLRNPNDRMMKSNFQYYLARTTNKSLVEDLDQKPYAQHYVDGLHAYVEEKYAEVIIKMEASLKQYVLDLNQCRAFCESEFNQGWLPDFVTAVANHFTFNLRCKQNCTENLGIIRGRIYKDVFASHYEYLQISYFNENQINQACRAAASFLLIHPDSEQMLENIGYYQQGKLAACKPRRESIKYFEQQRYEQKLLTFIGKEFSEVAFERHSLNDINQIDDLLRQH